MIHLQTHLKQVYGSPLSGECPWMSEASACRRPWKCVLRTLNGMGEGLLFYHHFPTIFIRRQDWQSVPCSSIVLNFLRTSELNTVLENILPMPPPFFFFSLFLIFFLSWEKQGPERWNSLPESSQLSDRIDLAPYSLHSGRCSSGVIASNCLGRKAGNACMLPKPRSCSSKPIACPWHLLTLTSVRQLTFALINSSKWHCRHTHFGEHSNIAGLAISPSLNSLASTALGSL